MKRVLCFGDSNTYGHDPKDGSRLPREQRWTGILAELLGDEYQIIEEGLCGRTTVQLDPVYPWADGRNYLIPCLSSQHPLDYIVLMLGTNDLQCVHNTTAFTVARGAEELVKICLNPFDRSPVPKLLLISPILVGDTSVNPYFGVLFGPKATELSKQLAPLYQEIADRYGCLFLDASKYAGPSPVDGLHMDPENHHKLAVAIAEMIQNN